VIGDREGLIDGIEIDGRAAFGRQP